MFKYSENKYNKSGFLKLILQKIKIKLGLIKKYPEDLRKMVIKSYSLALRDVREYMNINLEHFYEYSNQWLKLEEKLFLKNDSAGFYRSWNNKAAYYNICYNVINQHIEIMNFQVIASYFKKGGLFLDYGCGTASLSIGLFLENKLKGKLILLDVPNDVNEFVKYRIKKNHLEKWINFLSVLDYFEPDKADGIICIDVLEHLENSSEIFINKIHPLLKVGGLIYLRAPWRGQLTHIDKAADNFYLKGGRSFLSEKYIEIYRSASMDISCLYKKVKI